MIAAAGHHRERRRVYEQDDPSFYTSVYKTSDDRFVVIYAESTVSSEMRIAGAAR